MPSGRLKAILANNEFEVAGDTGNRVVLSWSLKSVGMTAHILYQDALAVLTEQIRILGNEKMTLMPYHDETDMEAYEFRMLTNNLTKMEGGRYLLELFLQCNAGYQLNSRYPVYGYDDETVESILSAEAVLAGLSFNSDVDLTETLSFPAMNLRLGSWLSLALEQKYGDKFIKVCPDDTIYVLDFNTMLKQVSLGAIGLKNEEAPFYGMKKFGVAGLMLLGDTVTGVYLGLPDGTETEETISFSSLGNRELVESVPTYDVTQPVFLGFGVDGDVPKNDIVAAFIERNERVSQVQVSTIGSTAWEPGKIVNLDLPGVAKPVDLDTFGRWLILGVDHVFGDGQWVSTLTLVRAGQVLAESKWDYIDVNSEAGGVVG